MNSNKEIAVDDELLVRYLGGEALPEEAAVLMTWLEDEQHAAYFEELEQAWKAARPSRSVRVPNRQLGWEKVEEKMQQSAAAKTSKAKQRALYSFDASLVWKIAAAVLIMIAGALMYVSIRLSPPKEKVVATAGELEHLDLSDRSAVVLRQHTVLNYPEVFRKDYREVELERGEAYFTITPDKERPFIIHTAVADVRVVGTAFNLSLAEGGLEIAVSEGTVMLQTERDTAYIHAGMKATLLSAQQRIVMQEFINGNAWAYATRRLVFHETPMDEVLREVEKTYQQTVKVSNEQIRHCKFTGTFDNESVEKLLALVAETLTLSLTKNDNGYTLQGEGCP